MKFTKGIIVGGLLTASLLMMCAEDYTMNTRKMTKKGKQFARKMGLI